MTNQRTASMMLYFHKTYLTGESVISGTQTNRHQGKELTRDLNRKAWVILISTKLKKGNDVIKKIKSITLMNSTFFSSKRISSVLDSNSYIKKINMPINPLFLKNPLNVICCTGEAAK